MVTDNFTDALLTIGAVGPAGPQGPVGLDDDKARKVFRGLTGEQGPQGPVGAQGDAGPEGRRGRRRCRSAGAVRSGWSSQPTGATGVQVNGTCRTRGNCGTSGRRHLNFVRSILREWRLDLRV